METTGRLHDRTRGRFRKELVILTRVLKPLSNGYDFQFGIDFLFEHALDRHQGAGE